MDRYPVENTVSTPRRIKRVEVAAVEVSILQGHLVSVNKADQQTTAAPHVGQPGLAEMDVSARK